MANSDTIKNIIIFLLIIGILVLGYLIIIGKENSLKSNVAMLDVSIYTFAENLYDSSEMFYDYYVYNYGDIEAQNIEVTCKSWDENMNLKVSLVDNFGSLASNSGKPGEVVGKNKLVSEEKYISDCYVSSCDNCKILYKEIPELVEYYEKE